MPHRNVEELKAAYPDSAWRGRFVEICDLMDLLGGCVIADSYTISDDLRNAITLSAAGVALRDKLVTKEGVAAKEAKLMCALSLGHDELFIDIEKTDPDELARAISKEVLEGRIQLPFVFGPELYDRYAELFEDEKDILTLDETLRLLDALPVGVFQFGRFTTGPYGVRRAGTSRSLQSKRRVSGYHCSRAICRALHPIYLETSRIAAVNRDREKLEDLLSSMDGEAAEWWAFATEVSGATSAYYGDQRAGTLIPLIGDALALDELRALISALLDTSKGRLRADVAGFLDVRNANTAVADLGRAELLQLALFARESELRIAVDRLVRDGVIEVPPGEVRRAVVSFGMRSGAFGLAPELGRHGIRFSSDEPGFALLRERRLLDALYVREADTDVEELEWQLRGLEIPDLDERLEYFFQRRAPREALERMVLARKTNMIAACEEVGLEENGGLSDRELIDTILWKLGFPVPSEEDPHKDFWARHERLWSLTQSSEIGGSERFIEAATPYFASLEGLLVDALAFSSWALLTDHLDADAPFSYDDEADRAAGLALMNEIAPSPAGSSNYSAERVDLGNLISGFSALAGRLEACVATPVDYERPPSELPDYDGKTELKSFLLNSTVMFLNLTPPSRDRIITGLREITQVLTSAEVNSVRNEYAHYRRTVRAISRLESALDAIRQAVTRIETLGLCRLLFRPARMTRDEWGRSVFYYSGPRGLEHSFSRPTRFDWMGLPGMSESFYAVRSAAIGEPTEVLRFTRRFRSPFLEMWSGYPNRRRRPRAKSAEEAEVYGAKRDALSH